MEAEGPQVYHRASLPDCYYDIYAEKVIIRLTTVGHVDAVFLVYNDPFAYVKTGDSYQWQYREALPERQLCGEGLATTVWRAVLDLPRHRRLKYGFRITAGTGDYYVSENGLEPYTAEAVTRNFNHFFFPFIHRVDAPEAPPWVFDTVWYQIFPERFFNGDPSRSPPKTADWERDPPEAANFFGGDLPGILRKLDYLAELGITGLFLNPVFKAPSNHKYDTEDYFTVDEHFGTLEDLRALVKNAHARGIRVMLDAVFNHVGERHPFWQDVLANQEQSVYRDYFHIKRFPVKDHYRKAETIPFDTFAMTARMPKWNTENPQARRYLLDAAQYWIRECDIDGWRLDVSDEVSFDFWRVFTREVRSLKPDLYIVGEMWHDASNWINPGYFNSAMNYPLGFAIIDFFLRKTIGPGEFTGRLFRSLSRYSDLHNRLAFNLLDSHDTPRALTVAAGDTLALRNAFTLLFLLPGSPCLYYGTEVGMSGGGDPACRGPMVWDEKKQDRHLLAFFKALIAFRRKYIGLIGHAVIRYRQFMGLPCWEIAGKGHRLSVLYTGDEPAGPCEKALGLRVFGTGQSTKGNIPPHSVAVYYT
ncbi:MAG: glycoside hydrolase family 13 protein [Treponema sp.]|jgi:neopullulanase|nr:glycoside hydrolase family 13 protein [Treponema sp.]